MKKLLLVAACQAMLSLAFAQKEGDDAVIAKFKDEGLKNSKVMDHAFYLTDVSGPRLTASPGFMNAAKWAKSKLESWGLKNVQIESWGDFGKGWQQERCYVAMTKPYYVPFIAQSKAWTGSTPGFEFLLGIVASHSCTFCIAIGCQPSAISFQFVH